MKFHIYQQGKGCWRLTVPDTMDVPHWWWPYSDYPTFADAVAAFDRAVAQTRSGLELSAVLAKYVPRIHQVSGR